MNFFDMTVSFPTVFAVEDEYAIAVAVNRHCLCGVTVGGNTYYDHANGVKKSDTDVHIIYIDKAILDEAKHYSVTLTEVYSRGPDDDVFLGGTYEQKFDFYPVQKNEKMNIIQIADTHSHVDDAIRTGRFFGDELSLLILNGDLSSVTDFISTFRELFTISGEIARGEKPCIFSRGNHDLRGKMAERYETYLPTRNGKTYFKTNIGDMCFIVLDCGEDKVDAHEEYHGVICCEQFRREETRYIEQLKDDEDLMNAKHRAVICHIPFPHIDHEPFNIETATYQSWVNSLNELDIDFYLFGHIHEFFIEEENSKYNDLGAKAPLIVGSALEKGNSPGYSACAIVVDDNGFSVREIKS